MAHPETQEAIGETAPGDPIDDILKFIPDDDTPEVDEDEPADEAEVPEEDEADEGEDETEDEPELPAIKPPVSWTAEEQAQFAELPRELQETFARREAEREKFVQSKATEAKTAELTAQAQVFEQVSQAQSHYLQTLQGVLPELPAKPPAHLMATDPHAYAAMMENYDNAAAWHILANEQAQAIQQQQEAAHQQLTQAQNAYTHQVLSEQFPEFLDQEKGPELKKALRSTALALGFPEENLGNLTAIEILAARKASEWKTKADEWDKFQSRKMANVRAARGLPKVSKPGTPAPREQSKAARADAAWQRAKTSKSGDDYADFLEASGVKL